MSRLDKLESQSIYIIREAYNQFKNIVMLWSIGKDSTVLLWLTKKAFLGHIPFPLLHIDTNYKIPEMVKYRDELALKWGINMLYGENSEALKNKQTFPDGNADHITCCRLLKTEALKKTLSGEGIRYKLDHTKKKYVPDINKEPYTGVIVGIRADEEGSRSKERYFSARDKNSNWDIANQPPELWNQFKTDFEPGTHVRIHPIVDWSELDIWKYINKEKIPVTNLYFAKKGKDGKFYRYRSLGCYPCTKPIESKAKTPAEIVEELESGNLSNIAERSGREQDKEDAGTLETLRRGGYM